MKTFGRVRKETQAQYNRATFQVSSRLVGPPSGMAVGGPTSHLARRFHDLAKIAEMRPFAYGQADIFLPNARHYSAFQPTPFSSGA
ncbi:hypothetical protein [Brevundimonas sp. UBA5718]|uniref:hypothetical protein n=1 Tax=Brevundimonas sp. UBA5718 TaxID=1946131 RepID=UPI0025C48FDE|nr:hypothetical protein [Brevundimonas sp. UBA5718]